MSTEFPEYYKHVTSEMINKQTPLYRTHEVIARGRRISAQKRTSASMAAAFLKRLDTVGLNPLEAVKRKPGRPKKKGTV